MIILVLLHHRSISPVIFQASLISILLKKFIIAAEKLRDGSYIRRPADYPFRIDAIVSLLAAIKYLTSSLYTIRLRFCIVAIIVSFCDSLH